MFALDCAVQKYAWGKIGSQSIIAQILSLTKQEPMAELWMGTHPNGPSSVCINSSSKTLLSEFIKNEKHANWLGAGVSKAFAEEVSKGQLPFLFKVLSVNQALSIQAHPDKALAKQLFANDPTNYKDDNHKPEICIALTEYERQLYCYMLDLKRFVHLEKLIPLLPMCKMYPN